MSADLNYSEIVKQAEAAVASIKDTELKGIAFGKILDTLLGQQHQGEGHMPVSYTHLIAVGLALSALWPERPSGDLSNSGKIRS